jgi:uncharacterized membrane protein YhhN
MGVVYILLLAIHLFAIGANDETLRVATKPLLMIALLMTYTGRWSKMALPVKWYIVFALLFSLAGDVLLLFQEKSDRFFMLGLAAFLLAHICYIMYFNRMRKHNGAAASPGKTMMAVMAGIYAAGLLFMLFPKLGGMKLPVLVYAAVISLMLISVIYAFIHFKSRFAMLSVAGALLFVASDSLLAVNKFYAPFPESGWAIMLTYGLAQLFIVWGSMLNLQKTVEPKEQP